MSYYIYKHINKDNEVVYIGQTVDMKIRQYTHKSTSEWSNEISKIECAEVTDSLLMDIYERYYISKHIPKYNKKDINCQYDKFFTNLEELEFKEYKKDIKHKNKKTVIKFDEAFENYYKNSVKIIENFKNEFLNTGKIRNNLAIVQNYIDCTFGFRSNKLISCKTMLISQSEDGFYEYRIKGYNLNLDRYNHLKTPEQLEYKSLDELWSEIFM